MLSNKGTEGQQENTNDIFYSAVPSWYVERLAVGLTEHAENQLGARHVSHANYGGFFRIDQGRLIGGIWGFTWGVRATIQQLWVEPISRGQGLGRKLLVAFEKKMQELGATCFLVQTSDIEAPAFYHKAGYDCIVRFPSSVAGVSENLFLKKISLVNSDLDHEGCSKNLNS